MREAPLIKKHATLPECFSKNGYHALSMGNIYHAHTTTVGRDSGQWAFDEWLGTIGGGPADKSHITSRDKNLIDGQPGPPSENTKGGGSEFAWGSTSVPTEKTRDYDTAQWATEQLNTTNLYSSPSAFLNPTSPSTSPRNSTTSTIWKKFRPPKSPSMISPTSALRAGNKNSSPPPTTSGSKKTACSTKSPAFTMSLIAEGKISCAESEGP